MPEQKYLVDINLNKNELKQAALEKQGLAPIDPTLAQIYFNTTDEKIKVKKTDNWKKLLDEDDSSNFVPTTRKVNNKALSSDITLYGTDIAMSSTDSTTLQAAIDNKVPKPVTALTPATKTKITYDANGLVTGGSDLSASDIPSITLSKISDVTATATEVNVLDGVTVTTADINSIPNKIELSSLSIDSSSTNYLGYDSTTGKISAKVDTTVTANSNKLITLGAVQTAINNAVIGGMVYKGEWTATGQTDYSSITLPVKAGYMYLVKGSATIGGIEWNTDDYLVINADVAVGGTITDVKKIDNTEGSDIVRLNATQTLTNKTIDADDNTISDLTTSNLKSGVLQTSVRAAASASDTAIVSEKAIRTELDLKAPLASPAFTGTPTAPTAATGTNTTQVATTAFVQDAISSLSVTLTATNTALTQSGGICTWTISNTLNNDAVSCTVREVSTGERVVVNDIATTSTITIKFNSSSDIAAGTYKAIIQGQQL